MAMFNNQRVSPLNHHGLLVKSIGFPSFVVQKSPFLPWNVKPGEAPADPIGLWEASTRARRDRGHRVEILVMGKSEMGVYVSIRILYIYTYTCIYLWICIIYKYMRNPNLVSLNDYLTICFPPGICCFVNPSNFDISAISPGILVSQVGYVWGTPYRSKLSTPKGGRCDVLDSTIYSCVPFESSQYVPIRW